MKIPTTYNKDFGDYEVISAGGHKCRLVRVVETQSQNGRKMLVVNLDTTEEDLQPLFFTNRYVQDKREDKKWPCKMYIVLEGEYAEGNLNRFLGAVEKSNDSFHPVPGADLNLQELTNLKVGAVFRKEEYTKSDLTVGTSVKPFRWCAYDKAQEQEVPKPKLLPQSQAAVTATTPAGAPIPGNNYGFVDVPADALEDEGLPFN